jgi:uncharacterized protein (TIGR02300 family)
MGRPELGRKCTCAGCHERFYDLNRSPAICPKCGTQQPPARPRALALPRPIEIKRLQLQLTPMIAEDEVSNGTTPEEDEVDDTDSEGEIEEEINVDADIDKVSD